MTLYPDKVRLSGYSHTKHFLRSVKGGFNAMLHDRRKAAIFAACALTFLIASFLCDFITTGNTALGTALYAGFFRLTLPLLGIMAHTGLLAYWGMFFNGLLMANDLKRIGLVNEAGEAPVPEDCHPDTETPRMTVMVFRNNGIPESVWREKIAELQAIRNVLVVEVKEGEDKRHTLLCTVPGDFKHPEKLVWLDDFLRADRSTIVLGEDMAGRPVAVNLAEVTHMVIAGSPGSGKSSQIRLVVHQALQLGMEVTILDGKGGMDYPDYFRKHPSCQLVIRMDDLEQAIREFHDTMLWRLDWLDFNDCKDIDEYNRQTPDPLPRRLLVIDELAQITDTTGMSAEAKKQANAIIGLLAAVTRLSRAAGMHILYSTQRPDANVFPGQLSSLVDWRACGRANDILSRVAIGIPDADTMIPKDGTGRGLFVTNSGLLYKGYWFDEDEACRSGGADNEA